MIQELTQLGLTDGEARVYLSLLKIGLSKVGPIVRDSHVSYSKIYDVLERLGIKGLVSHVIIDDVKHFNAIDRKSTRLNSSHANISYAVFCLKKKNMPL